MGVQVYSHQLVELGDDLLDAGDRISERVARVTEDSLDRIEKHAAMLVRGHAHLPHLPRSFTHDVDEREREVNGEVGAEWARLQGRLDVYIEYGTPTSHGIRHWLPAHDREVPRWIDGLERAAAEGIER